jgi:hypothetical protein
MARELSAPQRTAIRAIAYGTPVANARTLASLVQSGVATIDGETLVPSLTRYGRRCHTAIMATGDGPEDLKAMFRPLFGRARR